MENLKLAIKTYDWTSGDAVEVDEEFFNQLSRLRQCVVEEYNRAFCEHENLTKEALEAALNYERKLDAEKVAQIRDNFIKELSSDNVEEALSKFHELGNKFLDLQIELDDKKRILEDYTIIERESWRVVFSDSSSFECSNLIDVKDRIAEANRGPLLLEFRFWDFRSFLVSFTANQESFAQTLKIQVKANEGSAKRIKQEIEEIVSKSKLEFQFLRTWSAVAVSGLIFTVLQIIALAWIIEKVELTKMSLGSILAVFLLFSPVVFNVLYFDKLYRRIIPNVIFSTSRARKRSIEIKAALLYLFGSLLLPLALFFVE